MNIEELKNDIEAENFLIDIGVLKINKVCPYCGSTEVYSIRRNHFKCKSCRREWSKYNGTIFKDIRIKPLKFLKIIHELSKGRLIKRISEDLEVSYNTVLKIKNLILKRLLKKVFDIDELKSLFSVGIKLTENGINLNYIENFDINELSTLKNEKIGRLYIFKNYNNYDLYIVFSEKIIKPFEKNSIKLNLNTARKELRYLLKNFSEKVFNGKISNIETLLFTLTHSHLIHEEGEERIFYIFLEILKN
ncbi:transposase [Marinitoga aeolica]|uniref:Transposase n=1 Tax=Marinitoga aeolica TaxID=2809031 RepID=A0ABY8PP30_9BACT|nr:transposase [Marinitoga aeolica]WGS64402.1 transposase [Marinitoga aeolica]